MRKRQRRTETTPPLPLDMQIQLELWDRMQDGDIDALIQLSFDRGMMTQEDLDLLKKIQREESGGQADGCKNKEKKQKNLQKKKGYQSIKTQRKEIRNS